MATDSRSKQRRARENSGGGITTNGVQLDLAFVTALKRYGDGSIKITGAAWSDGTPLKTVEIKIDDGPWTPVKLSDQKQYTWTFWTFDWKDSQSGEHTIVSTPGPQRSDPLAPTMSGEEAGDALDRLRGAVDTFGARLEKLVDGSLVVTVDAPVFFKPDLRGLEDAVTGRFEPRFDEPHRGVPSWLRRPSDA